jgi:hypothetical protein
MKAEMNVECMELSLDLDSFPETKGMVLHFPPFVNVSNVLVKGKSIKAESANRYKLPIETKHVSVKWSGYPWPNISYNKVVDSYVKNYNKRIKVFKKTKNE